MQKTIIKIVAKKQLTGKKPLQFFVVCYIITKYNRNLEQTMKKRFLSIISSIVAVVMSFAVASGCKIITKDINREMQTVVATVKIDDYGGEEDIIRKQDLIMAYLNYGYYYVQYYGYTQENTFNLIVNNLINNRILIQNAMKENSLKTQDDIVTYLGEDEMLDVNYNTKKAINDLIDGYEDDDEEESVGDTLIEEVRTVPTDAENEEKETTDEEKKNYSIDLNSTDERKSALNKVLKLFKNNGLLGDYNYKTGDITQTDYYKNIYKSYLESALLTKWQKTITDSARKITFEELETAYTEKLNKQKAWSNEEFVEALGNASASDPILYWGYGNYGYVYNILLGVSDDQETLIEAIKTDDPNISDDDYNKKRNEILAGVTAKDLRYTWIQSGYDFDGSKFTGDYTFAKNSDNSLPFKGAVTKVKEADKDNSAEYRVDSIYKYGLDSFIDMMEEYVYGAKQNSAQKRGNDNDPVYRKLDGRNLSTTEYDAKINELLFAFSTDSGSLNTWKGYAVKPAVDGSNTEEYVATFADAARQLIEMGKNSYIVVATDYGYHIMFFSALFNKDTSSYDNLESYLNSLDITKGGDQQWSDYLANMLENWDDFEDTDNFLYTFVNSLTKTKVSNAQTKTQTDIVNKYRYENSSCVKLYKNNYADLLG